MAIFNSYFDITRGYPMVAMVSPQSAAPRRVICVQVLVDNFSKDSLCAGGLGWGRGPRGPMGPQRSYIA